MDLDLLAHLGDVDRVVGARDHDGRRVRVLTISRSYPSPREDVWDAVTDPTRVERWFLPLSGDLRVGGRYRLEGNASGEVLECDPPASFRVTWEFDDQVTWVAVRLTEADGGTTLRLEHLAEVDESRWSEFGPGAVGVGWDLGLLGLTGHLSGDPVVAPADAAAWMGSDEGRAYLTRCSRAWGDAAVAAGEDPGAARAAEARTTAAYTGSPAPDQS